MQEAPPRITATGLLDKGIWSVLETLCESVWSGLVRGS